MENNKKQPEIRFQDFNESWEQKNLGDFVEFYSGLTYSPTDISTEGTLVLRSSNVNNGEIIDADNVYVDSNVVNSRNVKIGDIIVVVRNGSRRLIGKHAMVKNKMCNTVIGAFMTGIRSKTPSFTNALLDTKQFSLEIHKNLGATINQITTGDFKKMQFYIPINSREQLLIGDFFNQVDEIISLHQKELTILKQTKQGFMQKMFPKEEETKPEVRFSGFNSEWKQYKLGSLGKTFTGLSGKTKEDFGRGSAEFVTYMNVFNNPISDTKMTENVEVDSKQNELKYGDVLFTTSSETPHEVGLSSVWLDNRENVYLNSFCFGFRPTVNVNSLYIAYLLRSNSIRKQMMLLAQGISRYNISKTKVMEISVKLPCIEEQTKIGEFFNQLDKTIELHEKELEVLKDTKKAFLQKMFV